MFHITELGTQQPCSLSWSFEARETLHGLSETSRTLDCRAEGDLRTVAWLLLSGPHSSG